MTENQEVLWLVLGIGIGIGISYVYQNLFPRRKQ